MWLALHASEPSSLLKQLVRFFNKLLIAANDAVETLHQPPFGKEQLRDAD